MVYVLNFPYAFLIILRSSPVNEPDLAKKLEV